MSVLPTLASTIFTVIGFFFTLTVNRKSYNLENDQFKHHKTRWAVRLVIFVLALLNHALMLLEAVFIYPKGLSNPPKPLFLPYLAVNVRLTFFTFLCIFSYHIRRCVTASPSVASFTRYLLTGLGLATILSIFQYGIRFLVAKSYYQNATNLSKNTTKNIQKTDWLLVGGFMIIYITFITLFTTANLVSILKAKFKARHEHFRCSCFVLNILVVYFLVFFTLSSLAPDVLSLMNTRTYSNKITRVLATGTCDYEEGRVRDLQRSIDTLPALETFCDLLQGLTLFSEQLYIFWVTGQLKRRNNMRVVKV